MNIRRGFIYLSLLLSGSADAGQVLKKIGKTKLIVKLSGDEAFSCPPMSSATLRFSHQTIDAKVVKLKKSQALLASTRDLSGISKKAKFSATCSGGTASAVGGGRNITHRPYKFEIDAGLGYSTDSSKTTTADTEGETTSDTSGYEISTTTLYILNRMAGFIGLGVGGEIRYGSSETKDESTSFGSSESSKITTTTTSYGPLVKAYFGDVNQTKLLPFAGLSYLLANSQSKSDVNTTKSDGTTMRLFGGAHFFVAPHVSVTPSLIYSMNSRKTDFGEISNDTDSTTIQLGAALSVFL